MIRVVTVYGTRPFAEVVANVSETKPEFRGGTE